MTVRAGARPMKRRIFLSACWRDLLLLNYEVEPELLRPYVPAGTQLDLFEGRALVSIVGFQFLQTRLLGWPIPGHRNFPEINLRLYVVREEKEELRRGVVFIRELVPKRAVAWVARWLYEEPYRRVPMRVDLAPPQAGCASPGRVGYAWKAAGFWHRFAARPAAVPALPERGTESEFIIEHYWGYTARSNGGTSEYSVEHPPWRIAPATDVEFTADLSSVYPRQFAEALAGPPRSAFVAEGSAVTVSQGRRLALAATRERSTATPARVSG